MVALGSVRSKWTRASGHIVPSRAEVDALLARAEAAGASRTDETHERP
jgi:hypothetical protein